MSLDLKPQQINESNWYYEDPDGIDLVTRVFHTNGDVQTNRVKIPWKKLKKSLERLKQYESAHAKKRQR